MSLFGKILNKLGFGKKEEEADEAKGVSEVKPASTPAPKGPTEAPRQPMHKFKAPRPAPSKEIPMVDVMGKLETMAEGTNLDWKVSIVDLLKVLDIDSSLSARKELAKELGCPEDLMGGDSAKMNVWLHKTVLKKLAQNGGNIPKELLD